MLSTPRSLAISCTRGFAATFLLSGSEPRQGRTTSGGRVSFRAAHQLSMCRSACSLVEPVDPYVARSPDASRAPALRNARDQARRAVAASMQSRVLCTHAPRPGSPARASATTVSSRTTHRTSEERGARRRQPTQVLTGSIVALSSPRLRSTFAGHAMRLPRQREGRYPASYSSITESGWISIFAPVSFAARRAF